MSCKSEVKAILPNEDFKYKAAFVKSYKKMTYHTGCYYMGYIFKNKVTGQQVGCTTNREWGDEYLSNYIDHCHLWRHGNRVLAKQGQDSLILPWSTVTPENGIEKDIILRKEELNIGQNGLSFCTQNSLFSEYFYFAPEKNNRHFTASLLDNMLLLRQETVKMRQIFSQYTRPIIEVSDERSQSV